MINLLKWLHKQLKKYHLAHTTKGFTLIELMVAMLISSIVISTLLSFVNNILTSDRQEQIKAITDQELQEGIDYIANDLKEAIYIYDADGIAQIKAQLPNPSAQDHVPVLVFWKRSFLSKDQEVKLTNGSSIAVGCLAKIPGTATCNNRDYFVYSLVAYYLIKDNNPNWSNTARIGRFEIQDGIRDPNNPKNYLIGTAPDPGFQLFDLSIPGSLKEKMNAWEKDDKSAYNLAQNPIETLVDYVDHSTGAEVPRPLSCTNISSEAQQIPANDSTANPLQIYSFSACVDSSRSLAQIYLRGNALARMNQDASYSNNKTAYFPDVNVQVQSRGMLNPK